LHDEVGYHARNRAPCLKSVLSKRVGDRHWREAIIMLVGLSNRPTDIIKWFAARLKNEARSGRLFAGKREKFFSVPFLIIATPAQIDLLMQCWESSAASSDKKHAWR
jgi:hypothetical protein